MNPVFRPAALIMHRLPHAINISQWPHATADTAPQMRAARPELAALASSVTHFKLTV